jgi:hypothetical protein
VRLLELVDQLGEERPLLEGLLLEGPLLEVPQLEAELAQVSEE